MSDETITRDDIENLRKYVKEQITDKAVNDSIVKMLNMSDPVEMVVYRGHNNTPVIKSGPSYRYYSSTLYERVAREEFAKEDCCVFKIHLVNVPVINVNKFLKGTISMYEEEHEFIFLGGGTFYKNAAMTEPGFLEKGGGLFECWYSIKPTKEDKKEDKPVDERNVVDIVLARISDEDDDEDALEFIDSPEDIMFEAKNMGITLSYDDAVLVFKRLKKTGGKRNIMKRKTRKTRKTKKTKKTRKTKKRRSN